MAAKKVKDAAGHMVAPIHCKKCDKTMAPCPCGYMRRCVNCCPGDPPEDVAENPTLLRKWRAAAGQRAAVRAVGG